MSSWIDALRPECGPLSDAAVRFAVMRGFASNPPRGVPALRDLLTAIRQHAADSDGDNDEGFIEGAGAFLGVVLAERFGTVRHVSDGGCHGLQLGQHGFFDPFACVARTLDADHQADALLSGVAAAEDEAHDRSHCAQVVACLARVLERKGSPLRIRRRVAQRIWLSSRNETLELDLDRLLAVTAGERPAIIEAAVEHFARALCGDPDPAQEPYALARRRLMPRLIGPAFRKRLAHTGRAPLIVEWPWHGPLSIALVLQYEGRARYTQSADLQAWSVSAEQAKADAMENLRRSPARWERTGAGKHALLRMRTGDGYDAARILLPEVQHTLAELLPSPLRVALPHRDALLACSAQDPDMERRLLNQAQDEARRAPHAVSDALWACQASGQWLPVAL